LKHPRTTPTDTLANLRGTATRSGCENKCAKVRWRAVLSPPRLPASWVDFNAGAFTLLCLLVAHLGL
ncbi:hypothetical protein, partial [Klebsiella pneumoniae]|uniref:hypothetical protein n=1 Tax=Klebsiella pneumoniae TaxID=573 RepID=UPI001C72408E